MFQSWREFVDTPTMGYITFVYSSSGSDDQGLALSVFICNLDRCTGHFITWIAFYVHNCIWRHFLMRSFNLFNYRVPCSNSTLIASLSICSSAGLPSISFFKYGPRQQGQFLFWFFSPDNHLLIHLWSNAWWHFWNLDHDTLSFPPIYGSKHIAHVWAQFVSSLLVPSLDIWKKIPYQLVNLQRHLLMVILT